MATNFTRVNSVVAYTSLAATRDAYLDAGFQAGGSFSANLAQENSTVVTTGQCYRGMPIGLSKTSGNIVPASEIGAGRAINGGVLVTDITPRAVSRGVKQCIVRRGTVRTYAASTLAIGDPVKADTSSAFSGFTKWLSGTDDSSLLLGHAFPLDDGSNSNGASTPVAMNQGDAIFVELG